MATRKRRKKYRLTSKGKMALGVIGAAFVLTLTFVILIMEGYLEHTDPQIVQLSSEQATIPI